MSDTGKSGTALSKRVLLRAYGARDGTAGAGGLGGVVWECYSGFWKDFCDAMATDLEIIRGGQMACKAKACLMLEFVHF